MLRMWQRILWMNVIGDKRRKCSFPFLESIDNIHTPRMVVYTYFIDRFYRTSFPIQINGIVVVAAAAAVFTTLQHSCGIFHHVFFLVGIRMNCSINLQWILVAIRVVNQYIKRNQRLMYWMFNRNFGYYCWIASNNVYEYGCNRHYKWNFGLHHFFLHWIVTEADRNSS